MGSRKHQDHFNICNLTTTNYLSPIRWWFGLREHTIINSFSFLNWFFWHSPDFFQLCRCKYSRMGSFVWWNKHAFWETMAQRIHHSGNIAHNYQAGRSDRKNMEANSDALEFPKWILWVCIVWSEWTEMFKDWKVEFLTQYPQDLSLANIIWGNSFGSGYFLKWQTIINNA